MSADLTFTAAMVQMRTSLLPEPSLEQGAKLIRQAASEGADYVLTPEVSNMMQLNRKALFEHLATEEDDLSLKAYRALARVIAERSGVKVVPEALQRIRPTQQQIGLSRPQRASNVQGAFKVATPEQSRIAGRHVILVDDVLTSGATVDACARALLRAKAASVDVLVFARVVDSHKTPI